MKTLLYTSGSSGKPKQVIHRLEAHFASAQAVCEHVDFKKGKCWLLMLPTHHVSGLSILMRAWHSGGAVLIPQKGYPFHQLIEQNQVTHISLVPTLLWRLLRDDRNVLALRQLEYVVLGGAALPHRLAQEALSSGIRLINSYGCTESASMVAATGLLKPGDTVHCGKPLGLSQIQIIEGEIAIKGPTLMEGYCKEGQVEPTRNENGFYLTGDKGFIDEAGNLHVLGRLDHMLISGGENIHPQEIELAMAEHPNVEQVVVVARHSEEYGQRPVAFVKYVDFALTHDEWKSWLQNRLLRFKIPDAFLVWPKDTPTNGLKAARVWLQTQVNVSCHQ